MIEIEDVAKRWPSRPLFHRLRYARREPGVVCVRGPNGSGKSTLLALLAGAAPVDAGDIRLCGHSLVREREQALRHVAWVPDGCAVYPFLTGAEWLAFVRGARGGDARDHADLVRGFGIEAHLGTRFEAMSLGTSRKFMLAAMLAQPAPVMLLDEPTNALDDRSLGMLHGLVRRLAERSLVILSCHDPEQQRLLGAEPLDLASMEAP